MPGLTHYVLTIESGDEIESMDEESEWHIIKEAVRLGYEIFVILFNCAWLFLIIAALLSLYEGQLVLMQVLKMCNKFFQQYAE